MGFNSGQRVRNFTAHGAQLAAIAVRPLSSGYSEATPSVVTQRHMEPSQPSTQPASQTIKLENMTATSSTAPTENSTETLMGDVPPPSDSDAKSDASFDPLFDDEPEVLDEQKSVIESVAPPPASIPNYQYFQPPPPIRATLGQIPPPKNAPPLLDTPSYATYSPNLLMTASIDGQVILWDRRVHAPGKGVGRLWMSEKTPPWCLSVSVLLAPLIFVSLTSCSRPVGRRMEVKCMRDDETELLMSGMYVNSGNLVQAILRGF